MNNVAHYRKLRGLTQVELAEMIGFTQPHVSRIERGDDGISIKMFALIADALNVTLSDLFAERMASAEAELIKAFRSVPPRIQKSWIEMARAASEADPPDAAGQ